MSIESLFGLASSMVLPAWAALLFAPSRWRVAPRLVCAIVLALAAIYTGLILAFWAQASGDFKSLDGIARLFDHRGLLLAGWVHYLAFDLLIG